jgi:hypothetical protein
MAASSDPSPFLKLLTSDDAEMTERIGSILVLQVVNVPGLVLQHVPEFKLVVTSLCCASPVRWGTITAIALAFSHALTIQPGSIAESIFDILDICYTVTRAYKLSPVATAFRPNLVPLVKAISRGFSGPLTMSIELLLSLTRQCEIGFVPSASFIPMMIEKRVEICGIIQKCDPVHYEALTAPISSSRRSVHAFYTCIWGIVIGGMLDRPHLILALSRHTPALLAMVTAKENTMLKVSAKYIFDAIKASSAQRLILMNLKRDMEKSLFDFLNGMLSKSVKRVAEPTRSDSAPPAPPIIHEEVRAQQSVIIHRQAADLFVESRIRSKLAKIELTLSPEAGLLMWPAPGKPVSKTEVCHVTAISGTKVDSVTKGGQTEHRLVLELASKTTVTFVMPTQPIATQWVNLIRGRMGQEGR